MTGGARRSWARRSCAARGSLEACQSRVVAVSAFRLGLNAREWFRDPSRVDSDLGRSRPHDLSYRQQRLAEVVVLEVVVFIATQPPPGFPNEEYRPFGIGVDLAPSSVGCD